MSVTEEQIRDGLRRLGLDQSSAVIVHASLKSFGYVEGGAEAVCRALVDACGTVLIAAGSWDSCVVPAPPGLVRPRNSYYNADSWDDFDAALDRAVPYTPDLPVSDWLGTIAETLRTSFPHERGPHPLFSYLAVGTHARRLVGAQRLDWPLGPIDELAALDGDVLLLGTGHSSNTTIHLAEQRLGRGRFFRYAKTAPGVWAELPNVSGESHRFDEIEPELRSYTVETVIGECRARRVKVNDVLAVTERMIGEDPAALLCTDDPDCRCAGALQQLLHLRAQSVT